jgi:profilin
MQAIVANYKDTAEPKKIFGTGIHVAGDKYVTIKADDRSLYGKKVSTSIL